MSLAVFSPPVILVLLATIWVGCDSMERHPESARPGDSGADPLEDAGSDASAEDAGTPCEEDVTCKCDNGVVGFTVCPGNTCDCRQCPEFAPATKDFKACGGEPVGTWQKKNADASSISTSVLNSDGAYVGSCPLYATEPMTGNWQLRILSSGQAAGVFEGNLTYTGLKSCFANKLGYSIACDDLLLSDGSCEDSGCGVCTCTVQDLATQAMTPWSKTDGSLYIEPSSFEYCVEGNTMKLRDEIGIVYELERFHGRGTPTACAQRDHDQCMTGLGCSWDGSLCTGVAGDKCSLGEYGVVPGCEAVPGAAPCVGMPTECTQANTSAVCTSIPGCKWEAGCTGGSFECPSSTTQLECEQHDCVWSACTGLPISCGNLKPEQCPLTPGCRFDE